MRGGNQYDHLTKRFEAQVNINSTRPRSEPKRVLMERSVNIDDLKDLKFEGRSLSAIFTDRRWTGILEAKGKVYSNIVREFYENVENSSGLSKFILVNVREKRVRIDANKIASFLDLPQSDEDSESSEYTVNEIYRDLTGLDYVADRDKDKEVISQKDLLPFFQMLHLIVAANVKPTEDIKELSILPDGKFLLDISRDVNINLPQRIFEIIENSRFGFQREWVPFGVLITGLSLKAGVKIRTDEQGHRPREMIRWTSEIISQTGQLANPLTRPAGRASSSREDHQIRPSWYEQILHDFDLRVAAQIAPLQSQLEGIEDRLQKLSDKLV